MALIVGGFQPADCGSTGAHSFGQFTLCFTALAGLLDVLKQNRRKLAVDAAMLAEPDDVAATAAPLDTAVEIAGPGPFPEGVAG